MEEAGLLHSLYRGGMCALPSPFRHAPCQRLALPPTPLHVPYALPGASPTQNQRCTENPGSRTEGRGRSMRLPLSGGFC